MLRNNALGSLGLLIYIISFLVPKKRNLFIFGEWNGYPRDDNAVALFNLVKKHNIPIEAYFIVSNWDERDGFVKKYSLRSIYLHLRARHFIVTHGKRDVLRPFVTRRSILTNVWHGIPIKKVGLLTAHKNRLHKVLALRDILFPTLSEQPDYVVCPETYRVLFEKIFNPRLGVIEDNLPRWVTSANENPKDGRHEKKYILYAPTFRDNDRAFFPLTVKELSDISEFMNEKYPDHLLLISVHPEVKFQMEVKMQNVEIFVEKYHGKMYQDVLPNTRLLITDISSIIFDAMALSIPYQVYFPDLKDYVHESRELITEQSGIWQHDVAQTFVEAIDRGLAKIDKDSQKIPSEASYVSRLINEIIK